MLLRRRWAAFTHVEIATPRSVSVVVGSTPFQLSHLAPLCGLQITISKDDTIVLDGGGDKKAIEERTEQVRAGHA
jgi:hypothetical protein